MSQTNSQALLQNSVQQPFLVRLATTEEMAQKVTVCKKCEELRPANGNATIHATLAYSRCRCHRVFKYRESQPKMLSSENLEIPLNNAQDSPETLMELDPSPLLENTKEMPHNSCSKSEANGNNRDDEVLSVEVRNSGDVKITKENSECGEMDITPEGNTEICHHPNIERFKLKRKAVSSPLLLVHKPKKSHPISNLIELGKYILETKQQKLKEMFTMLDRDGDGHLTYDEFLDCLPDGAVKFCAILKEFYAALNIVTYFGYREFIICYEIAERLTKSINCQPCKVEMDPYFMEKILSPFMKHLSMSTTKGGKVTMEDIKNSISTINEDLNQVVSITPFSSMPLIDMDCKVHILDCLALSPFFIHCT